MFLLKTELETRSEPSVSSARPRDVWVVYLQDVPIARCLCENEAMFVKELYERWHTMLGHVMDNYHMTLVGEPYFEGTPEDVWHGSVEELNALEKAWYDHGAAAARDGLCGNN